MNLMIYTCWTAHSTQIPTWPRSHETLRFLAALLYALHSKSVESSLFARVKLVLDTCQLQAFSERNALFDALVKGILRGAIQNRQ